MSEAAEAAVQRPAKPKAGAEDTMKNPIPQGKPILAMKAVVRQARRQQRAHQRWAEGTEKAAAPRSVV
jgi:hypothetical protein